MNPKLLGFLRALGVVVLTSVLAYLGDAAHLAPFVSTSVASLISAAALAWEHSIESKGNGALFGLSR